MRDARETGPPNASDISSPGLFEQFYAHILTDVTLQEKLRQPGDIGEFVALVVATARECGYAVSADDVNGAMRARMPLVKGLADTAFHETPPPPAGWLPVRASWQDDRLYAHWSYFGDRPLREPFFESDIHRANFKPFNRLVRYSTPIAKLGDWLREHPALPPSGFIFHMGRCGSTLVSQMLAALAGSLVISEPDPVDEVVRARRTRPNLSEAEQVLWLTWIIGALGQPRTGGERHYFIKLDSWHTSSLPLFRQAFPGVPWIFVYRDPVEVIVSQLRMPGLQMIPGTLDPAQFGVGFSDRIRKPEDYCARMLAAICQPILDRAVKDRILLVNYRELPEAVWETIAPHFGVTCGDADRAAMAAVARYDAKIPNVQFTPDVENKQQEATAATRAAAEERMGEIHRQLEALRLRV